jgi:hypothetical protein
MARSIAVAAIVTLLGVAILDFAAFTQLTQATPQEVWDVAGYFTEVGAPPEVADWDPRGIVLDGWSTIPRGAEGEDILAYVLQTTCCTPGFLVIPAYKELVPLLAFSGASPFPLDDDPNNALYDILLLDLRNRVAAIEDDVPGALAAAQRNRDRWDAILAQVGWLGPVVASTSTLQSSTLRSIVEPLLDTCGPAMWTQTKSPFIDKTVFGGKTMRPGCVALAVAQILHYHAKPSSVNLAGVQHIYASGSALARGDYLADDPSLSYPRSFRSDEPNAAISTLVLATGASIVTKYDTDISFADMTDARTGLKTTWKYGAVYDLALHGDIDQSLYLNLQTNLNTDLPCILELEGGSAYHAVVCDGWKGPATLTDTFYHLRLGYVTPSCSCDNYDGDNDCNRGCQGEGWYALPSNADYPVREGSTNKSYNGVESIIRLIEPS